MKALDDPSLLPSSSPCTSSPSPSSPSKTPTSKNQTGKTKKKQNDIKTGITTWPKGDSVLTEKKTNANASYTLEPSLIRTQAVLNIVYAIEGIDLQLLPAIFKALQTDYVWTLRDLGNLVLYQSLSQALCGLVWGYLADTTSRVLLLSAGCWCWGLVSMFFSLATYYYQFAVLRFIDGLAIASIGPIAQSLIADLFPSNMRGEQYGWMQLFQCGGCIIGALIGGSMASIYIAEGIRGWRLAFFSCGFLSVVIGMLVKHVAVEPRRKTDRERKGRIKIIINEGEEEVMLHKKKEEDYDTLTAEEEEEEEKEKLKHHYIINKEEKEEEENIVKYRFRVACNKFLKAAFSRTFVILLFQGICGYIPLHAFQFYTMWFQYIGMSDYKAGLLTACPLIGSMIGSLFGGWLGDQAHKWNRFSGRPIVGQIATLTSIPLVYTALLIIPRKPEYFGPFAVVMLLLGFVISWCPSGVNRPILSEIVEADGRGSVFATQIAVESSVAAFLGSPIITLLAESLFGFKAGGSHVGNKERNIDALANSLLVTTAFPWTVCFFLYGLLHFTYKEDAIVSFDIDATYASEEYLQNSSTSTSNLYTNNHSHPPPPHTSLQDSCLSPLLAEDLSKKRTN